MQFNMIFFLIVQLSIEPKAVLANYVLQTKFDIWKMNGKVFHYVPLVVYLQRYQQFDSQFLQKIY
jgi:hypothetical protein